MNYSFEDYEAAVIAALADLKAPSGYLKILKGYAGEFDEEKALENFLAGFPGVLVEIGEARYESVTMPYYYQEVTINLYLGARSWRNQEEARTGEMGIAKILTDIRDRLLGKALGLEIRPCTIIQEFKIGSDRHTVLYGAQYKIINDRIEEI